MPPMLDLLISSLWLKKGQGCAHFTSTYTKKKKRSRYTVGIRILILGKQHYLYNTTHHKFKCTDAENLHHKAHVCSTNCTIQGKL